ncbi:MAG: phasin family protein [Gammaproteobacteria bacterium]|jgi:hypothetical protein
MTTESKKASGSEKAARKTTPADAVSTSPGGNKPTISPAERWLLIRKNAYVRAQKHGFVGKSPSQDWLEAEKEIDAEYATDFRGVFSLTDASQITQQFKSVFAVYGLDHLSVEALLDRHYDGMEKLAAFNRKLINSTSELANQQTALVQDAITQGMKTLQSVAQGKVSTDGVTKQGDLSMKTIENALSHVKALTESVAKTPLMCCLYPPVLRRKDRGEES